MSKLPAEMFDKTSVQAFIRELLQEDVPTPQFFITRDRTMPIYMDTEDKNSWAKILLNQH